MPVMSSSLRSGPYIYLSRLRMSLVHLRPSKLRRHSGSCGVIWQRPPQCLRRHGVWKAAIQWQEAPQRGSSRRGWRGFYWPSRSFSVTGLVSVPISATHGGFVDETKGRESHWSSASCHPRPDSMCCRSVTLWRLEFPTQTLGYRPYGPGDLYTRVLG